MLKRFLPVLLLLAGLAAMAGAKNDFQPPAVAQVPAGPFISGSDAAEREMAYRLDELAYGHSATRDQGWYESELPRAVRVSGRFAVMITPVTNGDYSHFVTATGHPVPDVDEETWNSYGLIHPYKRTAKFRWKNGHPPEGRENHPVVLVSVHDARAYAAWLTKMTGRRWRLPSETEWEKAIRGTDGRVFPWGNQWDPARLNSHDNGPFDTLPVGSFPGGASPYGVLDGAGHVFEWIDGGPAAGRSYVKGGSWDDSGCGVCRPAARHSRPDDIKHVLIGFRLVREP